MLFFFILLGIFQTNPLTITVDGIKDPKGTIRIAVYDNKDTHLDEEALSYYEEVIVTRAGSVEVKLDLPEGSYSIAVYHDVNDDKELNTSLVGIPKEPYGFSNNAMGTFGPPSFSEASLVIPKTNNTVINLR